MFDLVLNAPDITEERHAQRDIILRTQRTWNIYKTFILIKT